MTKVRTIWQLNTIAIAIANKRCKINENILIYGFPITKFQTFNTSPLCVTPMRPGHSCKGSYLFILVEFLKEDYNDIYNKDTQHPKNSTHQKTFLKKF